MRKENAEATATPPLPVRRCSQLQTIFVNASTGHSVHEVRLPRLELGQIRKLKLGSPVVGTATSGSTTGTTSFALRWPLHRVGVAALYSFLTPTSKLLPAGIVREWVGLEWRTPPVSPRRRGWKRLLTIYTMNFIKQNSYLIMLYHHIKRRVVHII